MSAEPHKRDSKDDLDSLADSSGQGFFGELIYFLKTSKRWWLTPIILAILLLGLLVIFGGSGAAPFIYTLF